MKSWEHLESEPGLEKSSLSAAVQEEPRNLSGASLHAGMLYLSVLV